MHTHIAEGWLVIQIWLIDHAQCRLLPNQRPKLLKQKADKKALTRPNNWYSLRNESWSPLSIGGIRLKGLDQNRYFKEGRDLPNKKTNFFLNFKFVSYLAGDFPQKSWEEKKANQKHENNVRFETLSIHFTPVFTDCRGEWDDFALLQPIDLNVCLPINNYKKKCLIKL